MLTRFPALLLASLFASQALLPLVASGTTLAGELNLAEPEKLGITYAWGLERAVESLDQSAATEIAEAAALYADPEQNDFVLIQYFFHAPPFKPLQWIITPEGKAPESSAQHIALDPVQWAAFAQLIQPPFPQVRLSAPAEDYFSNPISFTRISIKAGGYSGLHYYITPRAAIRTEGWQPPFNSEEGWQNALRLLYALDNVRMVTGSNVFRAVADHKTLGEAYLNSGEHLLLAAAHHVHPGLASKDALREAANKLLNAKAEKQPDAVPAAP